MKHNLCRDPRVNQRGKTCIPPFPPSDPVRLLRMQIVAAKAVCDLKLAKRLAVELRSFKLMQAQIRMEKNERNMYSRKCHTRYTN